MPEVFMYKIKLKSGADKKLKTGYLWAFSNQLAELPKLTPGSVVELVSSSGRSYGACFYHPNSLISARLLKTDKEPDAGFFASRIASAIDLRRQVLGQTEACRIVFGESDYLPGLIVDRYGEYLSIQFLSAGMDSRKEMITESLLATIPGIKGIIEKDSSQLRAAEGLPPAENLLCGSIPDEVSIEESGLTYSISLRHGQKTGFYFDQRQNRLAVRAIAKGKSVLDCFTNQGGFALNAAAGGAMPVTGVDSSAEAIMRAKANAGLNRLSQVDFVEADVFDFLSEQSRDKQAWDIITLDPPAFAKSKKTLPTAIKGYEKLNRMALELLPRGGFLATSSCSHHLREDIFLSIVRRQALKLGKSLRLVYRGMQSPDHPVLDAMPETQYLKFFIFRVDPI